MKIAAVTILKNKSYEDINEWIKYIFEINKFDYVKIFDNNIEANMLDISKLYNNEYVSIENVHNMEYNYENVINLLTYNNFREYDYVFITDIDEFLYLQEKNIHNVVKEELVDKNKLSLSFYWKIYTDNNIIYEKDLKYDNKIFNYTDSINIPFEKYNTETCFHLSINGEIDLINSKSITKVYPEMRLYLHEPIYPFNYNKRVFIHPDKYHIKHYRTECLEKFIKNLSTRLDNMVYNYSRFLFSSFFDMYFSTNKITEEKINAVYELSKKHGLQLSNDDIKYLNYIKNTNISNIPLIEHKYKQQHNYTSRTNKIWIFTLATSVYNKFLHEQYKSFNNLFPNHEKEFIVISDSEPVIDEINKHIPIRFYKIDDHPYPLVTLSKYIYLNSAIPFDANDDDLFLFVDADTIFEQKSPEFYDKLYNKFIQYDMIFSYSPWFSVYKDIYKSKPFIINNQNINNYPEYMNDLKCYASHYDEDNKTIYVQTSFFGGKIKSLRNFNKDIRELMASDLNDFKHIYHNELTRHIPLASEENYTNKIINDHLHNKLNKYKILLDSFHYCKYYPFTDIENVIKKTYENIFLIQKYNLSLKDKKRNGN